MAEQPTTNSNSNGNGTVCHILPCSIEEDITAPIAQYFHPTPLPDNAMPNNGSDGDTTNDHVTIMAAQFRGRGLLCAVDASSSATNATEGRGSASAAASCDEGSPSSKQTMTLSKLPSTIMGVALSQSSSNKSSTATTSSKDPPTQSLKVVETFQHVYNWSHEHDVQKVMRERHGSDKCGLNAVLGWCDLAHEVHDPIPVPP
eukprot:CAMPEP_0201924892 /NCGR_PEP_ID=MMETSP0903-20130614/13882_1 /ASSEMBLY_ACC=CAM_ASM_000552 /TAXON_ID=420261 /ORGANISM="Thalassiosira antarctica, Strain CCMP982" /LENGTH=201 /DNA_ID=CAMNT_0048462483 /DNA_START=24 /DNA_END=629 /DNA_ORIENTATION=+